MLFYELVTDGFTLESLRNGEAPKVSRLYYQVTLEENTIYRL